MARPLPSRFTLLSFALALVLGLSACGKKPTLNTSNKSNNENPNGDPNNVNNVEDKKLLGQNCADNDECESRNCRLGTCVASLCNDGMQNGSESDVDCGAPGCPLCDIDDSCLQDLDCVSGICEAEICVVSRCEDGDRNGLESDVDCGGLFCDPCEDGDRCKDGVDCVSLVCMNDTCVTPACGDTAQNGDETDVDCGGSCDPCVDTLGCSEATDCVSGVCANGSCAAPSCVDMVFNGSETDVDCGGPACGPCADALGCVGDVDCISLVCLEGGVGVPKVCASPACDDGELNGAETDQDCGGPDCAPCAPGDQCLVGGDCASLICDMTELECTSSLCTDFIQNGNETDVDCGGSCPGCANTRACTVAADCASLNCTNNLCQMSECSDGTMNGDETDVDCGGSCNTCQDGQQCGVDADCQSGQCPSGTCAMAGCADGVRNGLETDVDCGSLCPPCDDGLNCLFSFDCTSGECTNFICQVPTCTDGTMNGTETDIDCGGGACPACDVGDACGQDNDCTSMICDGGANGPICAICDENMMQPTAIQCGFQGRGRVQQTCVNGGWVDTGCEGVWYRSCSEILAGGASTGDGRYDIDPDGPASNYREFDVFCDMTTDGGGWTEITHCDVDMELNGELTAVEVAMTETITACVPQTTDEFTASHAYYYTFDWPDGFDEFYLNMYEAKALAGANGMSELGHIQADWQVGYSGQAGDISFGSGTQVGPITSFSRFAATASTQCFECVIPWPDGTNIYNINSTSNKFRIGWGETGFDSEGWIPWYTGTIYVR